MMDQFDEQEYIRKLIVGGLSASDAANLAARMAHTYRASGKSGKMVNKPEEQRGGSMKDSAAVARSRRIVANSASPGATINLLEERGAVVNAVAHKVVKLAKNERSDAMAAKKQSKVCTASSELAEKVSQAKQTALLKQTKQQIKQYQLSLFDIAPWPDTMRALPNDYARSALFTTRNKRVPREALQGKEIFHVNKDVSITYTGVELRAEDDELVWQQILEYSEALAVGRHRLIYILRALPGPRLVDQQPVLREGRRVS